MTCGRTVIRRVLVLVAVLVAVVVFHVLLALLPGERVKPCVIPGHARTTVVECQSS